MAVLISWAMPEIFTTAPAIWPWQRAITADECPRYIMELKLGLNGGRLDQRHPWDCLQGRQGQWTDGATAVSAVPNVRGSNC